MHRHLLLSAIILVLTLFAWQALGPRWQPTDSTAATDTTPAATSLQARAGERERVEVAAAESTPPREAPQVYPADRPQVAVQGHVIDRDGQPVAGARVTLQPSRGGMHPALAIADDRTTTVDAITGTRGEFLCAGVPTGPWIAVARTDDGRHGSRRFAAPTRDDIEPLTIVVAAAPPAETLQVLVVDADDRGVAGAHVELRELSATAAIIAVDSEPRERASSGVDGTCTLRVAPDTTVAVTAHTDDGRSAITLVESDGLRSRETRVTLQLMQPGSVRGRLEGPLDALTGVRVQALCTTRPGSLWYANSGLAWTTSTKDGEFTFRGLPPGTYALLLARPRTLRSVLRSDEQQMGGITPWTVVVKAGEESTTACAVAPGGSIGGRVVTSDGRPVVGARVAMALTTSGAHAPDGFEVHGVHVWRLDQAHMLLRDHPETHATAHTDAAGRYRVDGLQPGPYRVDVFAAGLAYDQRTGIDVSAEGQVLLEHELAVAGVVQGVGCGHSYLAVLRPGSTRPAQFAILSDDGLFTFAGLAPGEWALAVPLAGLGEPLHEFIRVRVDAGRTTWADMRGLGTARISGRVLRADGSPASGSARLHNRWQRLRADGGFEFALLGMLTRANGEPELKVAVDGVVRVLRLPPAALDVAAWHGELRLPVHTLHVQLRDLDGRALRGRVTLHNPADGTHGTLSINGDRRIDGLSAGTYEVTAKAADLRIATAQFTLPSSEPLTLRAQPTAFVDVTVHDRHGRPVSDRTVYVCVLPETAQPDESDRTRGAWFSAATDAQGRARVLAAPGPALVEFGAGHQLTQAQPQGRRVTLRQGVATEVELRLP